VILEEGTPASTLTSLMQEGIAASLAKPNSPFFGSAEGIARTTDGLLTGVADFRRDATAYGE
jgi:gamma-glutamyltranspeptidase